jgi:hypothetical protein
MLLYFQLYLAKWGNVKTHVGVSSPPHPGKWKRSPSNAWSITTRMAGSIRRKDGSDISLAGKV